MDALWCTTRSRTDWLFLVAESQIRRRVTSTTCGSLTFLAAPGTRLSIEEIIPRTINCQHSSTKNLWSLLTKNKQPSLLERKVCLLNLRKAENSLITAALWQHRRCWETLSAWPEQGGGKLRCEGCSLCSSQKYRTCYSVSNLTCSIKTCIFLSHRFQWLQKTTHGDSQIWSKRTLKSSLTK